MAALISPPAVSSEEKREVSDSSSVEEASSAEVSSNLLTGKDAENDHVPWLGRLSNAQMSYKHELYVRRENKRLGWRKCEGVLRTDGVGTRLVIASVGVDGRALVVSEITVSGLSVTIETKRGGLRSHTQPAGGRPVHRLVLPSIDVGFFGAEAELTRDRWLAELLLAGADGSPDLAASAMLPFLRERSEGGRFVSAIEAVWRALCRVDAISSDQNSAVSTAVGLILGALLDLPTEVLIARGAAARCVAAACVARPRDTARLAAGVAAACMHFDACMKPLRDLIAQSEMARACLEREPNALKLLAAVAADTSRDLLEVRADAAAVLAHCPAVFVAVNPDLLEACPGEASRLLEAMSRRFPDETRMSLPGIADNLALALSTSVAGVRSRMICSLSSLLAKDLLPPSYGNTPHSGDINLGAQGEQEDDETINAVLASARRVLTPEKTQEDNGIPASLVVLERKVEVYERTFMHGGQSGLGLELTAGAWRFPGVVAPAVHRTNPATRARGVLPGDELIAVNGRRLEYRLAKTAQQGQVRFAMVAACEAVREAPWPKQLTFARHQAEPKAGIAARCINQDIRQLQERAARRAIARAPGLGTALTTDDNDEDNDFSLRLSACALLAVLDLPANARALTLISGLVCRPEAPDNEMLAPLVLYASLLETSCGRAEPTQEHGVSASEWSLEQLLQELKSTAPAVVIESEEKRETDSVDETAWWADPTAWYERIECTVAVGPLGCSIALRGDDAACRVESLDQGGAALCAGMQVGDVVVAVNDERPPTKPQSDDALLDFFKTYPLRISLIRRTQLATEDDDGNQGTESNLEFMAMDLEEHHDAIVSACASRLLYSSNDTVSTAAARCLGLAAALDSMLRSIVRAKVMDVRTATAVAMVPGLVQRLSSWNPELNEQTAVEGLSRDEAAALLPLAEATVSDAVPLADGAPRILVQLRPAVATASAVSIRGEASPETGIQTAASPPRRLISARQEDGADDVAVVPGSALSRLVEMATGDGSNDDVRCAALDALAALCANDETTSAACVVEPNATRALGSLLGGSRGGRVAAIAARLVRALVSFDSTAAALAQNSESLSRVAWLARPEESTSTSKARRATTGVTLAWRSLTNHYSIDALMTRCVALEIATKLCEACQLTEIAVPKEIVKVAAADALSVDSAEACRAVAVLATLAVDAWWGVLDEAGGLEALAAVVKQRELPSAAHATALAAIASCCRLDEAAASAVAKAGGIVALVEALATLSEDARKQCCNAIAVAATTSIEAARNLAAAPPGIIAAACLANTEPFLRCCARACSALGYCDEATKLAVVCARAVPDDVARQLCSSDSVSVWVAPIGQRADEVDELWARIATAYSDALWPLLELESPSKTRDKAATILAHIVETRPPDPSSAVAAHAVDGLLRSVDKSSASAMAIAALCSAGSLEAISATDKRRAAAAALASANKACRTAAVDLCGRTALAQVAGTVEPRFSRTSIDLAALMDDVPLDLAAPLALLATNRPTDGARLDVFYELRSALEEATPARACALVVIARDFPETKDENVCVAVGAALRQSQKDMFDAMQLEAAASLAASSLAMHDELLSCIAIALEPLNSLTDNALALLCRALMLKPSQGNAALVDALSARLEHEQDDDRAEIIAATVADLVLDAPPTELARLAAIALAKQDKAAPLLWALRRALLRASKRIELPNGVGQTYAAKALLAAARDPDPFNFPTHLLPATANALYPEPVHADPQQDPSEDIPIISTLAPLEHTQDSRQEEAEEHAVMAHDIKYPFDDSKQQQAHMISLGEQLVHEGDEGEVAKEGQLQAQNNGCVDDDELLGDPDLQAAHELSVLDASCSQDDLDPHVAAALELGARQAHEERRRREIEDRDSNDNDGEHKQFECVPSTEADLTPPPAYDDIVQESPSLARDEQPDNENAAPEPKEEPRRTSDVRLF